MNPIFLLAIALIPFFLLGSYFYLSAKFSGKKMTHGQTLSYSKHYKVLSHDKKNNFAVIETMDRVKNQYLISAELVSDSVRPNDVVRIYSDLNELKMNGLSGKAGYRALVKVH